MHVNVYTTFGKSAAGRFPQEMAHAIASAGVEVTLIAPRAEPVEFERKHALLSRLFLLDVLSANGLFSRIHHLVLRTVWSLTMLAKARLRSNLYLITFIGQVPAGLLHILWIRLMGGRIVFVIHDPTPHGWGFPSRFRAVERAMLRLSYRLSERQVTLTEAARSELIEKYSCGHESVDVIPHGAYIPSRTSPLEGDGQILLFGMLRRNKRIVEVITAFRRYHDRFPRLRLLIAGDRHKEDLSYWDACQAEIVGAENRIATEIGFIEEERMTEMIEASDGIILAYEDFNSQSGAAVLSCFSERVVIATSVGGLGELAAMGLETVTIDRPVTAESVADALERFALLTKDELREMATKSRETLEPKLSWSGIGRQYARVLQALSSSP